MLYPLNGYSLITGLTKRPSTEVDLAISLKGGRLLPGEFENNDQAIRRLFVTWNKLRKKDGLEFPQKIKVVTCGYIPMSFRYWAVDHVAVCFQNQGTHEKELVEFVANKLLPASREPKEINYGAPVFVSVNDRLIDISRP